MPQVNQDQGHGAAATVAGTTVGISAIGGAIAQDYLQRRFGISPEVLYAALTTAGGAAGLARYAYLKIRGR